LFQDSTNEKPINEAEFSSLDLSKHVFTSEDDIKILTRAENILQATKRQLTDLQMAMTCEKEEFQVETDPFTLSFSRLADLHSSF
jgi:hypothetical protein